jgi:hypothetical protein
MNDYYVGDTCELTLITAPTPRDAATVYIAGFDTWKDYRASDESERLKKATWFYGRDAVVVHVWHYYADRDEHGDLRMYDVIASFRAEVVLNYEVTEA